MKPPKNNAIPSKESDHDERSEGLAVDKHWDEEDRPKDEAMAAGRHLKKFATDGVAISDEDWEKEEAADDKIPDHVDGALDKSLEAMAEEEMNGEEGEDE
ncbi:MAG: hypothetical protein HY461_00795 [Parcubacteria group bacterium]|nr:hypothetical protein [Parcubacteria group bacterium]